MLCRYALLMLLFFAWLPVDGLFSRVEAQVQALPAYTVDPGSSPGYNRYGAPSNGKVYLPFDVRQADQRGQQAIEEYRTASRALAPTAPIALPAPADTSLLRTTPVKTPPFGMVSQPMPVPTDDYVPQLSDLTVDSSDLGIASYGGCEPLCGSECYTWQILPDGLMYKSYLAGVREPRFATVWFYKKGYGGLWDATLGGRAGLLRHGTRDPIDPQGWQVDIEGAAFPRLDMEHARDLVSSDFRFGIPMTGRQGRWQMKFAYYHVSAHLGDEYMLRYPSATRVNYVRDALVLGVGFFPHPDLRLYAETGWAFYVNGGAEPWEFQFGVDYSPARPSGFFGAPFFAVNGHLRQEVNYGGNLTAQIGWQWRGESGNLARVGFQYFNGMSSQYEFFNQFEDQAGVGIWYDY